MPLALQASAVHRLRSLFGNRVHLNRDLVPTQVPTELADGLDDTINVIEVREDGLKVGEIWT